MKRANSNEEGLPPRKIAKCIVYPKVEHFHVKFQSQVNITNHDMNADFVVKNTSTLHVNCAKYISMLSEKSSTNPRLMHDSVEYLFPGKHLDLLMKDESFQIGMLDTITLQSGRLVGMTLHRDFSKCLNFTGLEDAIKLFKTTQYGIELRGLDAEYSLGDFHFVQNLEVIKTFQGRGYGRGLLQRFIDRQSAHDSFLVKPPINKESDITGKEKHQIDEKEDPKSVAFVDKHGRKIEIQATENYALEWVEEGLLLATDLTFTFDADGKILIRGKKDGGYGYETWDEHIGPEVTKKLKSLIQSCDKHRPKKMPVPGVKKESKTKRPLPVVSHPPYELIFEKKPLGFSIEVPSGLVSSIQDSSLFARGLKIGSKLGYINGIKPEGGHLIKQTIRDTNPPIRIVFTSPTPINIIPPRGNRSSKRNKRNQKSQQQFEKLAIENSGPTSKYCGVSFRKSERKWLAQIAHRGSKLNIGAFEIEEDAARAWDAKAMQLRGDLTPVNFPIFPKQPRIQKNPKHGKAVKSIKRSTTVVEDKSSKFFTDMGFQRFTVHPDWLVYSSCYKQPQFSSYCKFIAEAKFAKELIS